MQVQSNAVAVARADQRQHKVDRLMRRAMPFAMRLAALNAMGGERRTM